MRPAVHERHQQVLRFIQGGDWEAAQAACQELTGRHPDFQPGWYLAAQITLRRSRTPEALALVEKALALDPAHPASLLLKAQCLAAVGRLTEVAAVAGTARQHAPPDATFWDALGSVLSRAGDPRGALSAHEEAVRLDPGDPRPLYNRAAMRGRLGDLAGAESDYDRVIAMSPGELDACRARAELRTQTPQKNHLKELEATLKNLKSSWRGEVQLRYALAKEYEDLGEHARSFEHLSAGARLRRAQMRYHVMVDVSTVNWIREAYEEARPALPADACQDAPIFIVGLPRSGSDLVKRILTAHPRVSSAGELDCFARALVDAVRAGNSRPLSRREMVARSAIVDFAALGRDYIGRARAAGASGPCFIDTMPLNYLYCGLIRRALPNARIIHVSRTPLAACHAIHRTLFEDGYPFSYDLTELGRYYIAYRWLMAHWRRTLPGVIHEVSHDTLLADPRGETQRLLTYCGLDLDDGCAGLPDFAASQALTAEGRRAVSHWRHYESQLAALRTQLTAAGVQVEPPGV